MLFLVKWLLDLLSKRLKYLLVKRIIRAYPRKEVQSICRVLTSGLPSTKELHLIKRECPKLVGG
jgi:hypothetical protein